MLRTTSPSGKGQAAPPILLHRPSTHRSIITTVWLLILIQRMTSSVVGATTQQLLLILPMQMDSMYRMNSITGKSFTIQAGERRSTIYYWPKSSHQLSSQHSRPGCGMSVLPQRADVLSSTSDVRKVP